MANQSGETLTKVDDQDPSDQVFKDTERREELPKETLKDPYIVLELDTEEEPTNFPFWKKVVIILIMSLGASCSTCTSSMVCSIRWLDDPN